MIALPNSSFSTNADHVHSVVPTSRKDSTSICSQIKIVKNCYSVGPPGKLAWTPQVGRVLTGGTQVLSSRRDPKVILGCTEG